MEEIYLAAASSLDVSIERIAVLQGMARFQQDPLMQIRLRGSSRSLEAEISFYSDLKDSGSGTRITVREYLSRNPEILHQNRKRTVSNNGHAWTEYTRHSTPSEQSLCADARSIYGGRFGEIMLAAFDADKTARKYLSFSGDATSIDRDDILHSIPKQELDLLSCTSNLAVLVHNHPDIYRDTRVYEGRNGSAKGFVVNGGLSFIDIQLANYFWAVELKGRIPLLMCAVNEDGLTHTYIAGTSRRIGR